MRLHQLLAAAGFVLAAALQSSAGAAPFSADTGAAAGIGPIQVQTDCHADVRAHRLPGYGIIEHRHRGNNCAAVLVDEEEDDDCHADTRAHRLPGYGNRQIPHRHRGSNCRVVIVEDVVEDCHRNPRQHAVPRFGNIWHRHVGPSCRVEELEVYRPGAPTQGCIRVGPVTVCP